jgi:PAS domain S-box-containing protein
MSQVTTVSRTHTDQIQVLHVDDESGLAEMVATHLQRANDQISVTPVQTVEEALDRLADTDFDCIVSDYDMPQKNGIEFLKTVRATHPDRPFILYTGKGSEEVASDAITAGATDYLQKETGTDHYTVLANRIVNVVERNRAQTTIGEVQRLFSELANRANDVLWLFTGDWKELVFLSESYEDIWGQPRTAIQNDPRAFLQAIHPDDRAQMDQAMQALSNGQSADLELRVNEPEGYERYVWIKADPITDDNGTVTHVGGFTRDITDRKARENELARAERQYEAMFEDPNILVGLTETDGTVRDINQTALDYIDATEEEILGVSFWDTPWFSHSESVQADVQNWIHRAADGEYVEYDVDLVRPDGTPYTTEGVIRPVTNETGDVVSLLISSRDVTERKEQERKRDRIIARVTDAIVEVDADWAFTLVNEQAEALYDMDESYLLGRDFWEVFDEAQGTRFEEEYRHVMETREPTSFVEYFSQLDGWFDIKAYPKSDGGIAFYFVEVTERHKREHQLEELNRITQKLMGADTQDEIVELGIETVRDLLGIEMNSIHLYDADADALVPAAITKPAVDLIGDPPTFTGDDSIAWRIYQDGEPLAVDDVHAESDRYNPDTQVRSELFLPLGKHGILLAGSPSPGSFDDEDVLLGEILAGALATALEQVERTEQLRVRERELTKQNARLEEFASFVSHDLRNPLAVASGRLELAATECESEHLDHVERAHERMRALIDDLLSLAHEGEAVTDAERVVLAPLVEGCWANVETGEATLAIDTERVILADKSRLKRLFENLMRNAIEHGGANVAVTVGELDDGFYIEDDGAGIPPGERETIFEAGYSTSEDGTGFGLSIVKQIVEAHDWHIHLTAGTEGGARFEITGVEIASE